MLSDIYGSPYLLIPSVEQIGKYVTEFTESFNLLKGCPRSGARLKEGLAFVSAG